VFVKASLLYNPEKIASTYFLADVLMFMHKVLNGALLRATDQLPTCQEVAILLSGRWKRCIQHVRFLVRGTRGRPDARHPKVAELKSLVRYTYQKKPATVDADPEGDAANGEAMEACAQDEAMGADASADGEALVDAMGAGAVGAEGEIIPDDMVEDATGAGLVDAGAELVPHDIVEAVDAEGEIIPVDMVEEAAGAGLVDAGAELVEGTACADEEAVDAEREIIPDDMAEEAAGAGLVDAGAEVVQDDMALEAAGAGQEAMVSAGEEVVQDDMVEETAYEEAVDAVGAPGEVTPDACAEADMEWDAAGADGDLIQDASEVVTVVDAASADGEADALAADVGVETDAVVDDSAHEQGLVGNRGVGEGVVGEAAALQDSVDLDHTIALLSEHPEEHVKSGHVTDGGKKLSMQPPLLPQPAYVKEVDTELEESPPPAVDNVAQQALARSKGKFKGPKRPKVKKATFKKKLRVGARKWAKKVGEPSKMISFGW